MKPLLLSQGLHHMHMIWARSIGAKVATVRARSIEEKLPPGRISDSAMPYLTILANWKLFFRRYPFVVSEGFGPLPIAAAMKVLGLTRCVVYLDADLHTSRMAHPPDRATRFFFSSVDAAIAVSCENADAFVAVSDAPVRVVEPAPRRMRYAPRAFSERPYDVCFVGRFDPEKGIDAVFRCLERLSPDLSVLFIGSGSMKPEIMSYCERRTGRSSVIDAFDDYPLMAGQSKIALFLSQIEPFGTTPLEVLQIGIIPIVTTGHGCRSYLPPESLVDADDIDGIVAVIERYLRDPDRFPFESIPMPEQRDSAYRFSQAVHSLLR